MRGLAVVLAIGLVVVGGVVVVVTSLTSSEPAPHDDATKAEATTKACPIPARMRKPLTMVSPASSTIPMVTAPSPCRGSPRRGPPPVRSCSR